MEFSAQAQFEDGRAPVGLEHDLPFASFAHCPPGGASEISELTSGHDGVDSFGVPVGRPSLVSQSAISCIVAHARLNSTLWTRWTGDFTR
jgi:hypothetical protein